MKILNVAPSWRMILFALFIAHCSTSQAQGQNYGWQPDFIGPGLMGTVHAMVLHEGDLYVGGEFRVAGEQIVNRVARWDGQQWSGLHGANGTGVDGPVYALLSHDGELWVGGNFSQAGGQSAANLARWDGQSWSGFAQAPDNQVRALAEYAGDVIVGGDFSQVGFTTFNRVARWDGSGWQQLAGPGGGTGTNGTIRALAVFNGELIAGGSFSEAGDAAVDNIARWNGSQWQALATDSPSGTVHALAFFQGELIVGGAFQQIGTLVVNRIARYNGTGWLAMTGPNGTGLSQTALALEIFENDLYVGGQFWSAGGESALNIARWDGSAWHSLEMSGINGVNSSIRGMQVFGNHLVLGGDFLEAGDLVANRIADWDGSVFSTLEDADGAALNNWVWSLLEHDGQLYAGGTFFHAGMVKSARVARWDGQAWSAMVDGDGVGPVSRVEAMAIYQGDLIAVGLFPNLSDATPVGHIARWDGTQWLPLAGANGIPGVQGDRLTSVAVIDDDLYVGGQFFAAGGEAATNLARWDGQEWHPLIWSGGNGIGGITNALTVYDNELIVGGNFVQPGGIVMNRIARWTGSSFEPLTGEEGTGVSGAVFSLAVLDSQLLVGGGFNEAGGIAANNIAAWNGSDWSALIGPGGNGIDGSIVWSIAASGPEVLVAGNFAMAGGLATQHIARWDGQDWSALEGPFDNGTEEQNLAAARFQDAWFVGGAGHHAGGVASLHLHRYLHEPSSTQILSATPNPADPGEPVLLLVQVLGEEQAPYNGRGTITADTGESCTTTTIAPQSVTLATFVCALTFNNAQPRLLTARYSASNSHADSISVAFPYSPNEAIFHDRFEVD